MKCNKQYSWLFFFKLCTIKYVIVITVICMYLPECRFSKIDFGTEIEFHKSSSLSSLVKTFGCGDWLVVVSKAIIFWSVFDFFSRKQNVLVISTKTTYNHSNMNHIIYHISTIKIIKQVLIRKVNFSTLDNGDLSLYLKLCLNMLHIQIYIYMKESQDSIIWNIQTCIKLLKKLTHAPAAR